MIGETQKKIQRRRPRKGNTSGWIPSAAEVSTANRRSSLVVVKTCNKCGEQKAESEFYGNSCGRGGLRPECKTCSKLADKAKYAASRQQYKERHAEYYLEHKEEILARISAYKEAKPVIRAAHNAVRSAVKSGRMTPLPCFICGGKGEAHHPDYSRPLDVVWLCRQHHREVHEMI